MIPVTIDSKISKMSISQLQSILEYRSYEFCVLADFTKVEAVNKLCDSLEQHVVEALMRIFEGKLGYRPLQNKIYEKTEFVFGDQDSYNINRLISSLRRVKMYEISAEDEKYITWFSNRVRYSVPALISALNSVNYEETSEA